MEAFFWLLGSIAIGAVIVTVIYKYAWEGIKILLD